MTIDLRTSICDSCVHLTWRISTGKAACDAFPDGIPNEIFIDGFDHRAPYPDDNGVRYELDPKRENLLKLFEQDKAEGLFPQRRERSRRSAIPNEPVLEGARFTDSAGAVWSTEDGIEMTPTDPAPDLSPREVRRG